MANIKMTNVRHNVIIERVTFRYDIYIFDNEQ